MCAKESAEGDLDTRLSRLDERLEQIVRAQEGMSDRLTELIEVDEDECAAFGLTDEPAVEANSMDSLGGFPALSEDADLAEIVEHELRANPQSGRMSCHADGALIFEVGSESQGLQIIQSGSLELLDSSNPDVDESLRACLEAGEMFGDIEVITGTPHRQQARARGDLELLTIDPEIFLDMLSSSTVMALSFCRAVANRFVTEVTNRAPEPPAVEAPVVIPISPQEGKLGGIDVGSLLDEFTKDPANAGVLRIADDDGRSVAEVGYLNGEMRFARYGTKDGEDALCDLFMHDLGHHRYYFVSLAEGSQVGLDLGTHEFFGKSTEELVAGVRERVDAEIKAKIELLQYRRRRFRRSAAKLVWRNNSNLPIARDIWERAKNGVSVEKLVEELQLPESEIYAVISELVDSRMIF